MSRIKNIATMILLTALMLLVVNSYVYAQNTAGGPYLNSWHQYSIEMGNTGNDFTWELYATLADAQAESGAISLLNGNPPWIKGIVKSGTDALIEIYFDDGQFSAPSTWYLVYSEISVTTGSCVARRVMQVDVSANTFELTVPIYLPNCNSYSSLTWDNTTADISNLNLLDSVLFTVNMSKEASFDITRWLFSGNVSITVGTPNNILAPAIFQTDGTTTRGYNWSITNTGGDFTLEVDASGGTLGEDNDVIEFYVYVIGDVTSDYTVSLTIVDGYEYSGSTYETETYNVHGLNTDINKYGIPNTSLITVTP